MAGAPFEIVLQNGVVIRCATADDAIALAQRLGVPEAPGASITTSRRRNTRPPSSDAALSLALLKAVKRAGKAGVLSGELARQLGLGGARAFGSISGRLRPYWKSLGLDFDACFGWKRSRDGVYWYATPELVTALNKINSELEIEVIATEVAEANST